MQMTAFDAYCDNVSCDSVSCDNVSCGSVGSNQKVHADDSL